METPDWNDDEPDLRVQRVSPEMVSIDLARRHAPCRLHCRFCPRTAHELPRDLPPPDEATQARLLEEFVAAVAEAEVRDVYLQSDDPLRYPGLFDWLDALKQAGVRTHIATPGLLLADEDFARRFVGYDLRFDLTMHGRDPDVVARMTGRDDAGAGLDAALANLRALGLEHLMGTVVTADNVDDLAATLTHLAQTDRPERLRVLLFYPDMPLPPPAYLAQFPTYDAVQDQLQRFAAAPLAHRPALHVTNLPPCQVDLSRLEGLRVVLGSNLNEQRDSAFEACATCPAADGCSRVHSAYAAQHPVREPDLEHVRHVLDALKAPSGPEGAPADAHEPLARFPLDESTGIWLVVEVPRDGAHYWFQNEHIGVYFTDPTEPTPRFRQLERLLGKVRRRLDAMPANQVTPRELSKIAAWARKALRSLTS